MALLLDTTTKNHAGIGFYESTRKYGACVGTEMAVLMTKLDRVWVRVRNKS